MARHNSPRHLVKKKSEEDKQRPLMVNTRDDKELHLLKRRKAELNAIIEKLKEKVKIIQQETNKKDTLKKPVQTRKKDLKTDTDHSSLLRCKEKQIDDLKDSCQQLTLQLETLKRETQHQKVMTSTTTDV
uniref:Uncharacterized protein n=1 Tax=Strigamia maritima TaxID=126957 RepID=T1IUA4_STRMM